MSLRTVSYGGGVQSTALLVMAAEGQIPFGTFIFANVGEDSEHPSTLRYVREVAMPYAKANGIELIELKRKRRDGSVETLLSRLEAGRTAIPVRRSKDGPPMSRSCTADFKTRVIGKWLRERGATVDNPAIVALGISTDEIERAKPGRDPLAPYQIRTYPLLPKSELDPHNTSALNLRRSDCETVIRLADLPLPDPSSCWFCPHHDREEWLRLKRRHPDLFEKSCKIEAHLSATSSDGKPVYLTRHGRPLAEVIVDDQLTLWDDGCESGWCMT